MVLFDRAAKEIDVKIAYYGAPGAGKTTNLQFLQRAFGAPDPQSIGVRSDRLVSLRIVWPERIAGGLLGVELCAAPGDVGFNSTKQRLLERVDGVVFVADSTTMEPNVAEMQNLRDNLKRHGVRASELPLVMQYNKRDLEEAIPVAELDAMLDVGDAIPAVATTGEGVRETLQAIIDRTMRLLALQHGLGEKFERAGNR